jgi:hypothetical protein
MADGGVWAYVWDSGRLLKARTSVHGRARLLHDAKEGTRGADEAQAGGYRPARGAGGARPGRFQCAPRGVAHAFQARQQGGGARDDGVAVLTVLRVVGAMPRGAGGRVASHPDARALQRVDAGAWLGQCLFDCI